jgi:hypothetical protein
LASFVGGGRSVKRWEAKVQVFLFTGHLEDALEVLHKLGEGGALVWIEMPAVPH